MPSEKKSADKRPHTKRRVFGRKQGRPLKGERLVAMDSLLPALSVPGGSTPLYPGDLFEKQYEQLWMEIGFGNGEHLAGLMRRYPERAYIGAEPFINGMSAFLKEIKDDPHDGIRVWMDDAIMLLERFEASVLDGIYVLNPDPWPKVRHHKRRIINRSNLDLFARVMKPEALLVMATDVDDLAEWMVTRCMNHPAFEWTAERASDWKAMPEDWIKTRYQEKGKKAGRKQTYLLFQRI